MSIIGRLFGRGAPPADGGGGDDGEPALSFARGKNSLASKTQFHCETWGLDTATWEVDLDEGVLTFRNQRGWTITAPVQVIGTLDTTDGTWLWGWDHPSVGPDQAEAATVVRAFGERHRLPELTTRKLPASEADAWRFTELATYLADAQGGYRGPAGSTLVFMTFGTINIRQDPAG